MKNVQVNNLDLDYSHLSEIGQSIDLRYAFAAGTDEELHQSTCFIKCRDFFSDELYYAMNPASRNEVFGYQTNSDLTWFKEYQNGKGLYMLLMDGSKTNIKKLPEVFGALPFLSWENDFKSEQHSRFVGQVKHEKKNIYAIWVAPEWLSTPVHIHLFTWILRMAFKSDKVITTLTEQSSPVPMHSFLKLVKEDTVAANMLESIQPFTRSLRMSVRAPSEKLGRKDNYSTSYVHDGGGIVSLLRCIRNYEAKNGPAGDVYAALAASLI